MLSGLSSYATKAGKAISGSKNITLKNYPILKKDSTFFDDKFLLKLQEETNKIKEEYIITNQIKNESKEIHKQRIAMDYIIPLCYLIYSFIYTKYFSYQIKIQYDLENKVYFSMFNYMFSHNNPVIKKVNVNLYKLFKKSNDEDEDKDKIDYNDIVQRQNENIKFLDNIIKTIRNESNYEESLKKYVVIVDNFNKIIIDIGKLSKLFESIEKKTDNFTAFKTSPPPPPPSPQPPQQSVLLPNFSSSIGKYIYQIIDEIKKKAQENSYNFTNIKKDLQNYNKYDTNLADILDSISINRQKDEDKFILYKDDYNICVNIYKNIIKKIQLINNEIVELNTDNKLIEYDDITLENIFNYYNIFFAKKEDINRQKVSEDNYIKAIKEYLRPYIEQKIDIYNELLNNKTFNKNNNKTKKIKIKSYLKNVNSINEKIIAMLNNNSISSSSSGPSSPSISSSISIATQTNNYNKIEGFDPITELFNPYFETLKKTTKFENAYINIIFINITKNVNTKKDITNEINKETIVKMEELKLEFNQKFREYKKSDKNIDFIKYLEIKAKQNKNILDDIEVLISSTNKNTLNTRLIDSINKKLDGEETTLKNSENELQLINENVIIMEEIKNYNNPSNEYLKIFNKSYGSSYRRTQVTKELHDKLVNKYKEQIEKIDKKISLIKKNIEKLKNDKDKLIEKDKYKQSKILIYNEYYKKSIEKISSLIKTRIDDLKNKNKNTNSSSDLKTSSNEEFNSIIDLSKKYIINIEKKGYNNSINKIYNIYQKNKYFIKITKGINENKNKKTTENNNNEKIPLINILSKYFSNNDLFINELKLLIFSKEFSDDNVSQFFKQYEEFYNIINRKIKTLLNKINTKILKYNENQQENKNKKIFIKKIDKKKEYIKKFDDLINPPDFKNKSGKYIQVIPYTDVMFIYFINLLMIIDYLNYYYE